MCVCVMVGWYGGGGGGQPVGGEGEEESGWGAECRETTQGRLELRLLSSPLTLLFFFIPVVSFSLPPHL